jgi:hypothetical protein
MSGRLSPRPNFDIPEDIINCHEWVADELIDGPFGHNCTLVYPVTQNAVCPNCIFDPRAQKSSGIYKTGGPAQFTDHTVCPWCGGVGRSSRATTSTIRLRIYWNMNEFRKAPWKDLGITGIQLPEGDAVVIGYMTDLPALEKADHIILNKDVQNFRKWKCEREGEAKPWGFRQNRYFVQVVSRVGGG